MRYSSLVLLALFLAMPWCAGYAQAQPPALPGLTLQLSPDAHGSASGQGLSLNLQVVLLFTVLALGPMLVVMMTSFTRMVVVLSFVRHAIGTQQLPPAQMIIGLALILSAFVMAPVFGQIQTQALKPYMDNQISQSEALAKAAVPLRAFMLRQTREQDLALFVELAHMDPPATPDDIPLHVLVPGFVISELRVAFQIGFVIFIPFLVIDMVVASVLMSMGMMMVPPVMVSLPFKILLFVLVDGWYLLVKSLVLSFH